MAQQCRTCAHPARREIHRCKDQGATLQELADGFGLTKATLNRHFHSPWCMARFQAQECSGEAAHGVATVAVPKLASGRSGAVGGPTVRRRAIGTGPSSVKPVSPRNDDPSEPPSAVPMLAHVHPVASIPSQPTPSLLPDPKELSLLSALGATDQELADLFGCGEADVAQVASRSRGNDRALFNVTDQEWAKHFVRLALSELIMLRRRRQDALDGKRWREADRMDPKIAKATESLFQTLRRFGMANPIASEELGHIGDDRRDILAAVRNSIDGRFDPTIFGGNTTTDFLEGYSTVAA